MSSHVGALMMGEWRAKVDGKEMSGKEALQKAGLKPLVPEGKDALAILSTNAAAVAETMDAARHARVIHAIQRRKRSGKRENLLPEGGHVLRAV